MWFPDNLTQLTDNPINGFQIAVWHELFDPYTPDTFQPRLLNSAMLIDELKDVAERASDAIWEKHIRAIKDELQVAVHEEDDILRQIPAYRWRINSLFKTVRNAEIILTCSFLQEERRKYEAIVLAGLQESVQMLPKGKAKVLRAIKRLATLAIHSGKAVDDFSSIITTDNLTKTKEELAERLLSETVQKKRFYDCVLVIQGGRREVQTVVRKVGFQLRKQRDIPDEPEGQALSERQATNLTPVAVTVEAVSARDAARDSAKQVRRALDVFNLYSNGNLLELIGDVYVKGDVDAEHRKINLSDQALRKLSPRKHNDQLAVKVLNSFSSAKEKERVFNALELYSLSHGSTASRVKLVNLWSAAECLAGLDGATSVIDRVCRVFAPIIMWRRVEKTVRYLANNLQLLKESGVTKSLGAGFPSSGKSGIVHVWETMTTLCKPENHNDMRQLLEFSSAHPLLCYRVNSAWKEFHDPKQLQKVLLESRQRIEWHLTRIYRARNLVIHNGIEVPTLPALFDNLHYYFSVTVSRILHAMTVNPEWGLAEAVAHWQAKVGYVLEMLAESPQMLRISDFFPGDSRSNSSFLWERSTPTHVE